MVWQVPTRPSPDCWKCDFPGLALVQIRQAAQREADSSAETLTSGELPPCATIGAHGFGNRQAANVGIRYPHLGLLRQREE
jgi:hypothetical protein